MTARTVPANPSAALAARIHPDTAAIALLIALWLLFFWRLFTPIAADQASLTRGDFSGQFVAFAAYQYERFAAGQVPLWNPYNNGGLPFIADTQAAVFYPPRLLTIALAGLAGGFSYRALEWEMTAHVLAYSLLLYTFVRRLTLRQPGTYGASVTAAIVGAYGGFLSGYPPLQLAILEAATWLPLALLGVHEAARDRGADGEGVIRYPWLALSGLAYGLSWMAGHPQTTFLMTWLLLGYLGCRVWQRRAPWTAFVTGAAVFGLLGTGLAAVQLLPGVQYLALTTRAGFGFDAKGNGFPIQDIVQFIYPNVVSVFSPLYLGVAGLALAAVALVRRVPTSAFWGAAALLALLWSFGANSLLYPVLYNLLPGAYFFRGQERAAFVVANAGAVLAGLGFVHIRTWAASQDDAALRRLRGWLWRCALAVGAFSAIAVVAWLGDRNTYGPYIPYFALSAGVALILALILPSAAQSGQMRVLAAAGLIGLLIFELFTVNIGAEAVYDPVPPSEQLAMQPRPLVAQVLTDEDGPFRVDGFRGLGANFGSLYGLADIHGISPLWLGSAYALIETGFPNPRAWELFAVRYVFTDWNELPVPSAIIGRGDDDFGPINLHRLENPRPFALLMNAYEVVPDDAAARARLNDPTFNPRQTMLLASDPGLAEGSIAEGSAVITEYAPEAFTIAVSTDSPALLSIAHVDYPGWSAELNGQPVPILRAYGGLMAVAVPAGEGQLVRLTFDPPLYRLGAGISLAAVAVLVILGGVLVFRRYGRRKAHADNI